MFLRAFSADSASVEDGSPLPQLRLEKTHINVAISPPVAFITALNAFPLVILHINDISFLKVIY